MARTQKKPKSAFAQRLVEVRGATSRADFAQALGVTERTLGSYERGEHLPSSAFLETVRDLRRVDLNWLIAGADPKDNAIDGDAYADLVDRIKERLAETGLDPSDASVQAGYPKDHLSDVLSGEIVEYRSDWLKSVAVVLKCNASWLLTGEGRFDAPDPEMLSDDVVWRAVREIAERPGVTPLDPSGLADLVVNLALHLQNRESGDVGNIVEFGTEFVRRRRRQND